MSPRFSDRAVREATGRGWDEWFRTLAEAEAGTERSHRELVALLESEYGDALSGWWRQTVTVEYEKHVGRRVTGETRDAGFQVGVSKTLATDADRAWEALVAPDGLARWLGGVELRLEEGSRFSASETGEPPFRTELPPEGEVRVVVPGDRVRLTWQPAEWRRPSTLQVGITDAGSGKVVVNFHHEHLPDPDAREAMRGRWKRAVAELAERLV